MKTYPVLTAIGNLEVYFVDANQACVWTPNGGRVTVKDKPYTANVSFIRIAPDNWVHVLEGQSAPIIKREFPDLRSAPTTVVTQILAATTVAIRAILEDEPGAPALAEIAYAEQAVKSAQEAAAKAQAALAEADEKLILAQARLRVARQASTPVA